METKNQFYSYVEIDELIKKASIKKIEKISIIFCIICAILNPDFSIKIGMAAFSLLFIYSVYRFSIRIFTKYTNMKIYYPKITGKDVFYSTYGCILKISVEIFIFALITIGIKFKKGILNNIFMDTFKKEYVWISLFLITIYVLKVHILGKKYITSREYCDICQKIKESTDGSLGRLELNRRAIKYKDESLWNQDIDSKKNIDMMNTNEISDDELDILDDDFIEITKELDLECGRKARNINIKFDDIDE